MSKEALKKELKATELSAKEKELQVVYEEIENALGVKTGNGREFIYDEDRNHNDPLYDYQDLASPALIDREHRFSVAYQYLQENFSEDFLKKSSVQPGPLYKAAQKRMQEAILDAQKIKNASVEHVVEGISPAYFDIEANKQKFDDAMDKIARKNNEKIELSPYKQRLQNLIKERTGR